MREHLQTILRSPDGANLMHPRANNTLELYEALNKQRRSGASGNALEHSPSIGLIKFAARSHSTVAGGMKNLKLPQLGKKNYVPSSNRDDFENSKIVSHVELRQLGRFQ
jgi:hypothetical protein